MKRNLLLFALTASAALCACSKDAALDEARPATQETVEAELQRPPSFAEIRQIVGDVLGDAVAATITPTSRYLKFTFDSTEQMLTELAKGDIEYLPAPMFREQVEEVTTNEDQPKPMYALVDSNVSLPEGVKCDVLAESFDPHSPLSGLSDEQADRVAQAMRPEMTRAGGVSWKPWGRVRMYDEVAEGGVLLPGVSVVVTGYKYGATGIMQSETCKTDYKGEYECKLNYYGPVSQILKWSNQNISVFSNDGELPYVSAPVRDNQSWQYDVMPGGPDRTYQFAMAFRAASYMCTKGYLLSGNYDNSLFWIKCLDQTVPANDDDGFAYANTADGAPVALLTIYCKNKTGLQILTTVNRELGKAKQSMRIHASSLQIYDFETIILDSWGEFTKYYFTEEAYEDLHALNKLHSYTTVNGRQEQRPDALNLQTWCFDLRRPVNHIANRRTPLFIDIFDGFNQDTWPGVETPHTGYNGYPDDEICYRDFSQLAAWSETMQDVTQLKTAVRAKHEYNLREALNVDKLFKFYVELESYTPIN